MLIFIKKYKSIIISSITIIFLGFLLIISAHSFGWFSNNKKVTVTGEAVTVETPGSIYISSTFVPVEGTTTIDYRSLEDNGFGKKMAIKSDNVLFPASTSNNIDFYYASTVNPDGSAADPMSPDKNKFVPIDTRYREYYYIEQSFYITSLYHDDVTVYISNVDILEGTSLSYIYKAVRLSATDGNTTSYFKCADGGGARPVSGVNTVLSSDNAISSGTQDETSFSFTIPKMVDGNCSYVKITFKIWIEGQNESAIVAYASTAFKVHVDFNVLEN